GAPGPSPRRSSCGTAWTPGAPTGPGAVGNGPGWPAPAARSSWRPGHCRPSGPYAPPMGASLPRSGHLFRSVAWPPKGPGREVSAGCPAFAGRSMGKCGKQPERNVGESMDTAEIEVFLTLAEELHFGRTAERLRLPQSRVSRLVARLERRAGG